MAENPALPAPYIPGSKPLRDRVYERYCRYRAEGLPRVTAYRQAQQRAFRNGTKTAKSRSVEVTSLRLEQRELIRQRIQYLSQDTQSLLVSKRNRLEEALWNKHEAAIGDYLEKYEVDGITKERPKLISELPRELQQNIEKGAITANGRIMPQLYSANEASKQLRELLDIGRGDNAVGAARLTDAELVAQLSEQAAQLGVKIDLNYSFLGDQAPAEPVDVTPVDE